MNATPKSTAPAERGRRQRGAVLALVGIMMMVLLGMAVLGVDVGHVAFTATEAQSVADVGSTAACRSILNRIATGNTSIDPAAEGTIVMQRNRIAGDAVTADNIESIVFGTWNETSSSFTPGSLATADAVRVTTTATVNNFFAGIFGDTQSTVRRAATARLVTPTCGQILPVAIGNCYFDFDDPDDCEGLPTLHMVPPQVENSCWTNANPLDQSAGASDFRSLLPSECCTLCEGADSAVVNKGDTIYLNNGAVASALQALEGCLDVDPPPEFIVPVIGCEEGGIDCTQSATVLNFAVATVIGVTPTGSEKGIDLAFKCGITPPCGGGSGSGLGAYFCQLVE